MLKGWTKMDEYSWRHDGYALSHKLNVFVDDGTHENHASSSTGSEYIVLYTVNNSEMGPSGSHVLADGFTTKKDAHKKATQIMRDNPDSLPEGVE